ncbi:unnamed protein product [Cuscuta campestris]|uniref:BED-type domain-containing protein n=1 Tax=Cuscuta campestris TaxID=132261 RepID=A0A484M7X8_9ASTE|nr:unnamed protein product [Cuscuta campestris]
MEIAADSVIVNSSRLKSVVWNDFDRVRKGDTFIAICRHCNRKLSGSSTSGTSHLRNHLIRCRRGSNQDISQYITRGKRKETTLTIADFTFDHRNDKSVTIVRTNSLDHGKEGGNVGSFNFDNRQSRLDLARMIILHGYPLAMVEHTGFRRFAKNLQPLFDIPTFDGVEADCKEIYLKVKQKVYEELDKVPSISLTADTWTANGDAEYLCLTAHYIDDSWHLKKKILNFLMIDPSQTEDVVSEIIMTSLKNWDIDKKLFSVTLDCYSLFDKIIPRIREQLCQHRFLYDGQLIDIRCAASLVKLMAKDALEKLFEIVNKIRESIQYVHQSQSTQEKFDEMAQVAGISSQKILCLDNMNQWSSTYTMLEACLEYKDAFTLLQEHDPHYEACPSTAEWDRANSITCFLKKFFDISNTISGSKYSTANMYFNEICDIHLLLIGWCQNSDDFIRSLALKMKTRFDEYWNKCSMALAIAVILDPRFKMKLLDYFYPQIYGTESAKCIDTVSNCMKALYHRHAEEYSPLASHGPSDDSREDRLMGYDRFLCETSDSHNIKSDLDKYLDEPLFPRNVDFDILNWWRVHTPRFPILSTMACNVLGIPLSKGGLEFIYDTGNRTLDSSRGSLRSDTLQALMCAQDWMRHEHEDSKDSSRDAISAYPK